ncbi:N-acetylmuramoyl-L-alanine amidase [Puia sp.]|jgi:N-acetylmuramoyl-L-alanine amidase|uniref:N-acetylmuramoyl-L-alanine amidase n=1 Tax=Puia sp. TaxID=2045100 RepID=UPI002F4252E8
MIEAMLKSGGISAVLFGYYWLFLRNRSFHGWNRGFLLSAVLLSVVMPLVPLPGLFAWAGEARALGNVLHAVVPGNWAEDPASDVNAWGFSAAGGVDWGHWMYWGYALVAGWLGLAFLRELGFIARLYRRYPRERREDLLFLLTREPGTPFSFLKTIFWNADIEPESIEGRQMLRHELVHIRQRHTLDLLLLRPLMILFWVNPIFYLIYRELRTIHEFEADRCALEGEDRYAYAELLVLQTLESRQTGLFHSFFSSSIKRRITMITQFSAASSGRLGQWMVAPVAVLLLFAFSGSVSPHVPGKPMTVVIDAGHGGVDDGAIAANGLKEKDINLAIARKVKQLSSEYGVNVVLTRDADVLSGGMKSVEASLHYRAGLVTAKKADLFISLHVDAKSGDGRPGFNVYLSKENTHFQQSAKLGGVLIDALRGSYTTGNEILETRTHVLVLRAATVPAVLIECGNIDDARDRAFINDGSNQETIARNILQGVTNYK